MTDSITVMQDIIALHHNNPKWNNAPLGGVKTLSNTHVGAVGQAFVQEWCNQMGMAWEDSESPQGPWDARIEGVTFEIKTATEDVNSNFQFNHIRHHREYQALLCLGISPDAVLFDAWRKGRGSGGDSRPFGDDGPWVISHVQADEKGGRTSGPIDDFQARIGVINASLTN